ncbi:MAG TPA: hypothetical protein VHC42_10545 [Rhizomicrobium sp.]|nr:hypothetical protein [Rhizomicrobium sp.]
MPKNVAQLTGMIVTAIVVFGTDLDVYYAMPLGVMAGALATLLVALAEYRGPRKEPIRVRVRD